MQPQIMDLLTRPLGPFFGQPQCAGLRLLGHPCQPDCSGYAHLQLSLRVPPSLVALHPVRTRLVRPDGAAGHPTAHMHPASSPRALRGCALQTAAPATWCLCPATGWRLPSLAPDLHSAAHPDAARSAAAASSVASQLAVPHSPGAISGTPAARPWHAHRAAASPRAARTSCVQTPAQTPRRHSAPRRAPPRCVPPPRPCGCPPARPSAPPARSRTLLPSASSSARPRAAPAPCAQHPPACCRRRRAVRPPSREPSPTPLPGPAPQPRVPHAPLREHRRV
mmetsp:Transcript_26558/g.78886  ORF Transcript_26558/g.78886 Transcript_26558/m.78886 type:complete len:280 (-) Transcript_26558:444-1283(-)